MLQNILHFCKVWDLNHIFRHLIIPKSGMKKISRKTFIKTTGAGLAGLTILPGMGVHARASGKTLLPLGSTGIMVTPVCFGASRAKDEALISYALEKDINFLDTGRAYARGNNERLVGRVIKGRRKDIVVQSKMYLKPDELNFRGKGKRGSDEIKEILSRRIEESLEALGTDYIDIMLFHSADNIDLTFHDAVLKFYDNKKSEGVIRAHGFSSHDYELNHLKKNNKDLFYDVIMHPFNFSGGFTHSLSKWAAAWDQELLINLLKEASKKGTGIVAMKSCSAGAYSTASDVTPSFKNAVDWVLEKDYIHSAAVAMSSYNQIDEHMGG